MTLLCPSTFNNQLFCKGQPSFYLDKDIFTFEDQFCKQLHFNFSATRNSATQRKSRGFTRASWLRDIDLDIVSSISQQLLSIKRHKLSRYILEDILDCPVNSCFIIVCLAANGDNLECGDYFTEQAVTNTHELKWAGLETKLWRMTGWKYIVI
jgi:hypothetical protein